MIVRQNWADLLVFFSHTSMLKLIRLHMDSWGPTSFCCLPGLGPWVGISAWSVWHCSANVFVYFKFRQCLGPFLNTNHSLVELFWGHLFLCSQCSLPPMHFSHNILWVRWNYLIHFMGGGRAQMNDVSRVVQCMRAFTPPRSSRHLTLYCYSLCGSIFCGSILPLEWPLWDWHWGLACRD